MEEPRPALDRKSNPAGRGTRFKSKSKSRRDLAVETMSLRELEQQCCSFEPEEYLHVARRNRMAAPVKRVFETIFSEVLKMRELRQSFSSSMTRGSKYWRKIYFNTKQFSYGRRIKKDGLANLLLDKYRRWTVHEMSLQLNRIRWIGCEPKDLAFFSKGGLGSLRKFREMNGIW